MTASTLWRSDGNFHLLVAIPGNVIGNVIGNEIITKKTQISTVAGLNFCARIIVGTMVGRWCDEKGRERLTYALLLNERELLCRRGRLTYRYALLLNERELQCRRGRGRGREKGEVPLLRRRRHR